MKWTRATEETIPKSSGFPIMLIVKWFEGEGDDERTLVRHMTANQLLDKVKGTWNYHYFLDETPTSESQWPTEEAIEAEAKYRYPRDDKYDANVNTIAKFEQIAFKAAIQWLRTSGVREGTRERENQWCDNDMKNALSEHYPGTDIDDYFKTWIVNYKK